MGVRPLLPQVRIHTLRFRRSRVRVKAVGYYLILWRCPSLALLVPTAFFLFCCLFRFHGFSVLVLSSHRLFSSGRPSHLRGASDALKGVENFALALAAANFWASFLTRAPCMNNPGESRVLASPGIP